MTTVLTWCQSGGTVTLALTFVGLVLGFILVERFWAAEAQLQALASTPASFQAPARLKPDLTGSRRMAVIRACIVIAPLLGLLGTVNGIIRTFEDIVSGGYLVEMSAGIGQALYTTEHGLAIAALGLLAERLLLQRLDKLACLAQIAAQKARKATP